MFTFTDEAKAQVLAALKSQNSQKTSLRVEARADGGIDFAYAMRLIAPADKKEDDQVFDGGGFEVVVDPESAGNLKGATVSFEEGEVRSGFRFDNPNRPPAPTLTGPSPDKVRQLLEAEINPAVAAHGGMIRLVDVRDNKVYVAFGGGCHGCGMVDVTLKHGVEARIREVIPEIEEVIDVTDHRRGRNPYHS